MDFGIHRGSETNSPTDTMIDCIKNHQLIEKHNDRHPTLSKVHFASLCFHERPILVPISANQKKSKENFCSEGGSTKLLSQETTVSISSIMGHYSFEL